MAQKPKRKVLVVPLRTIQDEKAILKVSESFRRNMADTARELFHREYQRILKEEKSKSSALPESVAA